MPSPKLGIVHTSTTSAVGFLLAGKGLQRDHAGWKTYHPSSAKMMFVVFTCGLLTNITFWRTHHSTSTSKTFLWHHCEPWGKKVRAAAKGKESLEEKMFQSVITRWCYLLSLAMALLFTGFCVVGAEERSHLGAALAQILLPGPNTTIVIYAQFSEQWV